jgi:hypothetical protein
VRVGGGLRRCALAGGGALGFSGAGSGFDGSGFGFDGLGFGSGSGSGFWAATASRALAAA